MIPTRAPSSGWATAAVASRARSRNRELTDRCNGNLRRHRTPWRRPRHVYDSDGHTDVSDFATWTAGISGAVGTVTYKWFHKSSGSSTWTAVGTNSSSYSRTVNAGSHDVRVDVTTSTQAGTDTHTYWAEPTCGEFAC